MGEIESRQISTQINVVPTSLCSSPLCVEGPLAFILFLSFVQGSPLGRPDVGKVFVCLVFDLVLSLLINLSWTHDQNPNSIPLCPRLFPMDLPISITPAHHLHPQSYQVTAIPAWFWMLSPPLHSLAKFSFFHQDSAHVSHPVHRFWKCSQTLYLWALLALGTYLYLSIQ